jgi:hypothetical protein
MEIKKATRKKVKLKMGLSGPSGSGKTMSALLLAYGMTGDWNKVGVIDTENGSASLYSHLGEFLTIDLTAPFSPERYTQAIKAFEKAGVEVLVIDSTSHEWSGPGGCIELNESLAQSRYKGNTWSAWNEITPRHDEFVTAILQSPCHIISCTRSKTETVMGEDKKVKKVGLKEIQRENWEYELTINLTIDRDTHKAVASKDRTGLFDKQDPFVITPETGKQILQWCNSGIEVKPEPTMWDKYMTLLEESNLSAIEKDAKCTDKKGVYYTEWPLERITAAYQLLQNEINQKGVAA